MKEVNTILEMLIESRTQLLEAKARIKEREAEINKDLSDCEIAIAALTPRVEVAAEQPQEQTERTPNVGDELVWIGGMEGNLEHGKIYPVVQCSNDHEKPRFVIEVANDCISHYSFPYSTWRQYFRFADEQTPEDLANLHSYLHVNGEAKKPYRIKTWDEMVNTEGCSMSPNGIVHPMQYDFNFNYLMKHLCGQPLDHNGKQYIEHYVIEPWMITENK